MSGPEKQDRYRPIQPRTGVEDDEGYKAVVKNNIYDIRDQETISKNCITINKRIGPAFTYSDLEKIITDIYTTQKRAFKFNFGFGFVLYNTTSHEFRYFYNSSNNLLFERAVKTLKNS